MLPHPNVPPPGPPLASSHTMAPPSFFIISGIFELSQGERSLEQRHYADYLSSIDFVDPDDSLNVTIRKYTPLAEDLYGDPALVYVVAKAALPVAEEGMLDAIHCAPFEFSSVENLPRITTNIAHAAGIVTSVTNGTTARIFTLSVAEYVRGERRNFSVMFVCILICPLLCDY